VAEDRHGPVGQVGDDHGTRLAGTNRPAIAEDFHVDAVGVDMQAVVALALASDQADFLATITVGHRAGEYLLDDAARPAAQDHGSGDDAARPDAASALAA